MMQCKTSEFCATACAIAIVLLFGGGCVSGTTEYRESGTYVSSATLRQIEVGQTTDEWVLGVLGEPTQRVSVGEDEEVWKYLFTEERNRRGQILFVTGNDTRHASSSVFLQVKDHKITKKWQG